jgi:hypothetical protein
MGVVFAAKALPPKTPAPARKTTTPAKTPKEPAWKPIAAVPESPECAAIANPIAQANCDGMRMVDERTIRPITRIKDGQSNPPAVISPENSLRQFAEVLDDMGRHPTYALADAAARIDTIIAKLADTLPNQAELVQSLGDRDDIAKTLVNCKATQEDLAKLREFVMTTFKNGAEKDRPELLAHVAQQLMHISQEDVPVMMTHVISERRDLVGLSQRMKDACDFSNKATTLNADPNYKECYAKATEKPEDRSPTWKFILKCLSVVGFAIALLAYAVDLVNAIFPLGLIGTMCTDIWNGFAGAWSDDFYKNLVHQQNLDNFQNVMSQVTGVSSAALGTKGGSSKTSTTSSSAASGKSSSKGS